jgi:hypothetical protein
MATKHFKPNKKITNDGLGASSKTNGQKAIEAETLLLKYAHVKSNRHLEDYHIADLLADIRHLCHRDGRDFDELAAEARTHFIAER